MRAVTSIIYVCPRPAPVCAQEEGSGEPCTLPLAAEEWADELLSRVFAVLGNLDAPAEHRGADAGSGSSPFRGHSFLMSSEQSMFRFVFTSIETLLQFHTSILLVCHARMQVGCG